jgi:hypothetical protein
MEDEKFHAHVHSLLEKHLVVRYDDQEVPDMEVDENSALEMESLVSDIDESQDRP